MTVSAAPILWTLPWVSPLVVALIRSLHSRSLSDFSASAPLPAPRVSVVIPARNEERNIDRCVRSVLATHYPSLEVIVVDDHSTDDTGAIAASIAARDPRLRVIVPPPLPNDWFGKQWACANGAATARGAILGFLDADTRQAPDLVTRVGNAMAARGADLLSVAGTQEMGSFWERLVQPQVFGILLQRYGSTEHVNRSRFASAKIANGQCLFVRRDAYDAAGGHAAVRDKVAEDLAMAQHWFRAGRTVSLVLGMEQLTTRMYTSLRELVEGWGKNVFAGGRDAMPFGALGRVIFPLLLLLPALFQLVPAVVLALGLAGLVGSSALTWAAIATGANVVWWALVYLWLRVSPAYALLHPLGAVVLLYISLRAMLRGRRVRWKERDYRTA